jgi:hypothetical protein
LFSGLDAPSLSNLAMVDSVATDCDAAGSNR